MKTPFFNTPQRRMALVQAAHSWGNTPFSPHGTIKGAGVDCVNFPALVYCEVGFLSAYKFPDYTIDGGAHLAKSAVIEWVEATGKFDLVPGPDRQPGDLLLFKIARAGVEHHCGLMLQGEVFTHCLFRRFVSLDALSGWRNRNTRTYRPMEEVE